MTEIQFKSSIKVLTLDMRILQRNVKKLARYVEHKNPDKYINLFSKVKFDFEYLKKLYDTVQREAYWKKSLLNQIDWMLFTQQADALFIRLETIFSSIESRNEVMINGDS